MASRDDVRVAALLDSVRAVHPSVLARHSCSAARSSVSGLVKRITRRRVRRDRRFLDTPSSPTADGPRLALALDPPLGRDHAHRRVCPERRGVPRSSRRSRQGSPRRTVLFGSHSILPSIRGPRPRSRRGRSIPRPLATRSLLHLDILTSLPRFRPKHVSPGRPSGLRRLPLP